MLSYDLLINTKSYFIIDDQNIYRKSLKELLYLYSNHCKIYEFSDSITCLRALKGFYENPIVFFIDLVLGNSSGLDLASIIKEKFPNSKIVIMTSSPNRAALEECIENNFYFLEKGILCDLLIAQCNKID